MKVELVTVREGKPKSVMYEYLPREEGEKPMALDVCCRHRRQRFPTFHSDMAAAIAPAEFVQWI